MTKNKLPLADVQRLAGIICHELAPYCDRIEVAGSIRRQAAEVGDIEIVCIPKVHPNKDLFGNQLDLSYPINEGIRKMVGLNQVTKNGERYKQFDYIGHQVDLFLTTAEQWGVIFAIRTGPAEFSQKIVTQKSKGGYLNDNCLIRDGWLNLWEEDPGKFVSVPVISEEEFFAFTTLKTPPPPEKRK